MQRLLGLGVVLTLVGCMSAPVTLEARAQAKPYRDAPGPWETGEEISATESDACAALGGGVEQVLFFTTACVYPSVDAGKRCTDSSQCEGTCQAKESAKRGSRVVGRCSERVNTWGCENMVIDGIASGLICAD